MHSSLNLARKWRCKSFDTLIGQDITLKFLKNSLYKGILYPLYIFSGMRGTGKTTVARIFSAALLCDQLSQFQKNPRTLLPCYKCNSCKEFELGNHPDISEIDAASHTGVDTIRSLIENAYLLPILSTKKVYIIDEAHMLSKAAFNACLKLMEEPPAHVHFILATTDSNKIIDTIRSRSIQLHFDPLDSENMISYLSTICEKEGILYTKEGLAAISHCSQGSVRDALNIIERVRIVCEKLEEKEVAKCLGIPLFSFVEKWINCLLSKSKLEAYELLKTMELESSLSQSHGAWELICIIVRKKIFTTVNNNNENEYKKLVDLLDLLYTYEPLYMHSSLSNGILELLTSKWFLAGININYKIKKEETAEETAEIKKNIEICKSDNENNIKKENSLITLENKTEEKFNIFLEKISLIDKMLGSLFKQAKTTIQDFTINCTFSKRFLFYKDFIEDKKNIWTPSLKEIFGQTATLKVLFTESLIQTEDHKEDNNNKPENIVIKKTEEKIYKKPYIATQYKSALIKNLNELFPGTTEKV